MRVPFGIGLTASLLIALLACSSSNNNDGQAETTDAGAICSATSPCPSGYGCWYDRGGGCDAVGHCLANSTAVNTSCKAMMYCACDGTRRPECGRTPGDGLSDAPIHGAYNDPFCGDAG